MIIMSLTFVYSVVLENNGSTAFSCAACSKYTITQYVYSRVHVHLYIPNIYMYIFETHKYPFTACFLDEINHPVVYKCLISNQ